MPRPFERNLLFDGAPPAPVVEPDVIHLLGREPLAPAERAEPAEPVMAAPLTKAAAITVAISRSRGVDPADTQQIPGETSDHIELRHTGLGDILHR